MTLGTIHTATGPLAELANAADSIVIPSATDDKYSRGVLGVVTGSTQYPGAAVLGVEAALRTGLGMLRYCGPAAVGEAVLAKRPEIVIGAGRSSAWLLGSGIDPAHLDLWQDEAMSSALASGIPCVLDAGALGRVGELRGPGILTPHGRELSRLLGALGHDVSVEQVLGEPAAAASLAASATGCTVLLNGSNTTICSPGGLDYRMPAAPSWLATAGTGDVLAGILGALVATNAQRIRDDPETLVPIAAAAVTVHSLAATLSSGGGPLVAFDVAKLAGDAVRHILTAPQ
ncbi:ADP-dependent NAD(P)H-hydrate dehydratase [Lysinibacter cavernae]|uniref:ADP-dependent (S)-NAD(P)H-hydrate dehydratase n=1 Tax=Lysinibacter cavernae TaxID=1640652 RepID=A0A7X5R156_9MICO|nr:ADP/ATP-dependent (S)-NAD(P)H-hydrate dehydratase [Lysinibacter cavernae]NIH53681.1 NAD(P)H-hydrate repair Nnr-like enzyme with NAD(P)H-hydrate dehydratase domain [Lysinibacter cavernae]